MAIPRYLSERQVNPRRLLNHPSILAWKKDLQIETFPFVCHESPIALGPCDKVFSSVWLSDQQVLCGTKCNQLLCHDTVVEKVISIPTMERPFGAHTGMQLSPSGMHSMARSPSQELLAAGGQNVNDVAFYRLPTLEPYTLGMGHQDWVFALCWLNDDIILSGSRDHQLLVWSLSKARDGGLMEPLTSLCFSDDLVRDMAICNRKHEVALLSPNGRLRFMDIEVMIKKHSVQTPALTDNVCVTINEDQNVYAVGSSDCFLLADASEGRWRRKVQLPSGLQAVRSLAFREHTLTIGCGTGEVLTYDLRKNAFFGGSSPVKLKPKTGTMRTIDSAYEAYFTSGQVHQAVYTISYSPSGHRLFTAGGPLNAPFYGSFASIYK